MKSILKNALVGVLLIAGTTKPTTQAEVAAALITLIPADGIITDTALKANVGDLDISYPFWIVKQINGTLAKGTNTANCTIQNGIVGNGLAYVRTLAVDHVNNTAMKLVTVTENKNTVCGIQFDIAANGNVTATYKTPAETAELLNKSYVKIEHGLDVRQLANQTTVYIAGAAIGLYGLYKLHKWDVKIEVADALKAAQLAAAPVSKGLFGGLFGGK